MFIFGHYHRDSVEERGVFPCPRCGEDCDFELIRTTRYFHVFFIPVLRESVFTEKVICSECEVAFPTAVLAEDADAITSAVASAESGFGDVIETYENVVELSDIAAEELRRRFLAEAFGSDIVVRITPNESRDRSVSIAFDFVEADGQDWLGQSKGIPIIVDLSSATRLRGRTIDFQNDTFLYT